MKLFDHHYDFDYGHDNYFTIGQFENFNIIDVEIHTSEYWSWNPRMRLTFEVLCGNLFSIDFNIWSFSFSMDFISYQYPYNLSHTRELWETFSYPYGMIISTGGMNADALNTLDVNQKRFISQKKHMMNWWAELMNHQTQKQSKNLNNF